MRRMISYIERIASTSYQLTSPAAVTAAIISAVQIIMQGSIPVLSSVLVV